MAKDKPLILVVDDDVDIAESFEEAIKETGKYGVITANSGKAALDIINKNKGFFGLTRNKIRLILLDIRMPDMSGVEVLEKLKNDIDSRIDIMMVSAYDEVENWADTFFSYDVVTFIEKPVKEQDLISLIDSYFRGEKNKIRQDTLSDFGKKGIFEQIKKMKEEQVK